MNSLEFQIYDYLEGHEQIKNDEASDDDENDTPGQFIIHSFGRCDDGKSVYAKIIGYTPYFYILLPNKLQNKQKSVLEDIIKEMELFFKSKDNKKVFYKFKSTLKEMQLLKLKKAEGFTNDKEFYFARLVFNNADGMKKYKSFLENNDISIPKVPELTKSIRYKLYEANLPPMLRCFHIRDISGCSWVETSKYKLIENDKESRCNIEIVVDWRNLNPIMKDHNAPLRICSFDIECNSIDGEFPQARRKGDCVIQIGATYTTLGKSTPYRQYIGCLKNTAPIDNIIVDSFDTEEELMLAFLNEINENDCDIMTGYNIFFFDEKYMYDRCKDVLNIDMEMSYMSKLKSHKCNFKEMKLASSALGENLLRFWDTPGRIHIDLMKDVQKTFNLQSYKLDSVASKFIRGEVTKYEFIDNYVILSCKSVQDILVNDYIHIELIKGFVSDEIGYKYLVTNVDTINKTITIKSDEAINELKNVEGVLNWSQAKDDVGPKDIFRLQKGSPDDRAIVAKYCVKDCKLVNLLINKLEVVTKNIEMSNVCYVPLSFLFIRGQGIKLFSLCLKEFRKQKYAFPVLKVDKLYKCTRCKHEYLNKWECPNCKSKSRDEIESETTGYEGAIVFDPVPNVDYEALATKDYMSLYPASIMHKNMSHETIVEDAEYDKLPNIKYYNAQFKESDGSIKYLRFAQVENKLGVIPTILDNLLKTRKNIKKQMGRETDPFKYKILDAKQLAVKITANSLYGQLGASTSPVCKRDIAACTTSTGREMLIFARKYDEEYLPWIINGYKHFYANNQLDKIEILNKLELKDQGISETIKKYILEIKNYTFQPIIRYGDTDSIFSCYRFRENTELVDLETSLSIWKDIVAFAKVLIEPYFPEKERKIFNEIFDEYYNNDKVISLKLPDAPDCLPESTHNAIILPIDERIKLFIREYMQESYIPWLWTLSELVEKNQTFMFDIKLGQWVEHLLLKQRIISENLYENRKNYLIEPIMNELKKYFVNKYVVINNSQIESIAQKFIKSDNSFVFANEIKFDFDKIKKLIKILCDKTIKEKWIFSNERRELTKVINQFLMQHNIQEKEKVTYYLIEFINANKDFDINKLTELLNKNLLSDKELGNFDEDLLNKHTKSFIEDFIKNSGKKRLDEIVENFIEKELELSFDLYKNNHYNKVIDFANKHNYWIQPRWDFNPNKEYWVDIYKGGQAITDKRTLELSMEMGKLSGETIKSRLPFPHDCEYEKTFWPFAILTKKRYVGNKYEFDPKKYKQDFMGIVLKRRDNAAIVKEICGGIINYLVDSRDPEGAINYTKKCIQDMFDGKYDIKYFLQSRTLKLKESYKDWRKIAHVYLAEKIAQRDPGNTPQSGDRIEFAVIKVPPPENGMKLLQGDIIETPKFIKDNNLEIDYLFYLTNQIMNPALQFLELVDKNAVNIFNGFIEKYSNIKKKVKKVKPEKVVKEKKVKPEKVVKEKVVKKNALDVLNEIKGNNKKQKLMLETKKLIDEINESIENEKNHKYDDIFFSFT